MLSRFKQNLVDAFIASVSNTLSSNLAGTVTANTTSTTVVGVGTNFVENLTTKDRIFVGTESRQIISITNSTQIQVASEFDNSYTANTYKKGAIENNNYYVFAARQSPYDNEEQTEEVIDNPYESTTFIHDEMMFGRKVTPSDVVPVASKRVWASGTVYTEYDDKNVDLANSNFFVLTSENKIYKCIFNNNNANSTSEPSHNEVGFPPEESDGYRWLYLYEITNDQFLTFSTENYIPVFPEQRVKTNSLDGAIFNIRVIANGSNYPADSGTITTTSNNRIIQIDGDSSTANQFFQGCAITIINDTDNRTYVKQISDYISNNSGKFVQVSVPFTSGEVSNNQYYSIAPFVNIDSSTGEGCVAYCQMQNINEAAFVGSLQKIIIVNPGSGYLQANVSIQSSPFQGDGALARAIISPPGGHGYDTEIELYSQSVGIGLQFSNTNVFGHSSEVEFRAVGVIKNPLAAVPVVGTGSIDIVFNSRNIVGSGTLFTSELQVGDYLVANNQERFVESISNNTYLTLNKPFSFTLPDQAYEVRSRFSNSHFNQTVYIVASNTTPNLLEPGEFVVGSDGAGGGSQVQAKVAALWSNSTSNGVVLTGLDRSQTRGLASNTSNFVADVILEGVGYSVTNAASETIAASGAKYSKAAGNTAITTTPDIKLYSGEILYIQNVLPIQRSNTSTEQVRLVIKL